MDAPDGEVEAAGRGEAPGGADAPATTSGGSAGSDFAGAGDERAAGRWAALALICLGVTGALSTWFSATAIVPELRAAWGLSATEAAWLTNGVQVGFVVGALGSSLINLPDLVRLPRLIAVSAATAAVANLLLLTEPGAAVAIGLRVATGIALAGVYPPALKLMATWFVTGRGVALGFLIGALTLGSSMPHLFRALGAGVAWQPVVVAASAATLASAAIFGLAIREGPHAFGRASFDPSQSLAVFRDRALLLANLGYFGHMWELYAMWAWFLAFAAAAEAGGLALPFGSASTLTFAVIAVGVVGCVAGGLMSDRIGRCRTTALMMIASGASAVAIGFAFDGPAWLLALLALIWGVTVIGDSAQFSAAVTELAEQRFVGTALALQLGIGFSLTVAAIWALPLFATWLGGWQWAFLLLVPGPVVGAWSMLALRRLPAAAAMAGGAR